MSVTVAVEKGTKAVISVNFSVYGLRTFNNLRTNFAVEIPYFSTATPVIVKHANRRLLRGL
jgi:hypothetical protein